MEEKKEAIKIISVRFPMNIYDRLSSIAKKERRSFNQQVIYYLENEINVIKNMIESSLEYKPPPDQGGDAKPQAEGQQGVAGGET